MRIWSRERATNSPGMRSCFREEDHATEFGGWIDFYFFATSNSSTYQHAYFLPHIILFSVLVL